MQMLSPCTSWAPARGPYAEMTVRHSLLHAVHQAVCNCWAWHRMFKDMVEQLWTESLSVQLHLRVFAPGLSAEGYPPCATVETFVPQATAADLHAQQAVLSRRQAASTRAPNDLLRCLQHLCSPVTAGGW